MPHALLYGVSGFLFRPLRGFHNAGMRQYLACTVMRIAETVFFFFAKPNNSIFSKTKLLYNIKLY